MVSVKTRRLAVPVVACFGVLGLAGSAHAAGGLSVTPAILEHQAKVGTVGSLTLNNTTQESLKVTVTVRPWRQELSGRVLTDPRANFNKFVRASSTSFTLAGGAERPPTFRLLRRPPSGSLSGNVDVLGKPVNTKGRKGIIPQYRLISTLRLTPATKKLGVKTGAAQVRGGHVLLPVRNMGNTIDPVGGSFRISGPTSRNGTMKAIAALPGKLVGLDLGATAGMKKGRYTVSATVSQGGRNKNVS